MNGLAKIRFEEAVKPSSIPYVLVDRLELMLVRISINKVEVRDNPIVPTCSNEPAYSRGNLTTRYTLPGHENSTNCTFVNYAYSPSRTG